MNNINFQMRLLKYIKLIAHILAHRDAVCIIELTVRVF